MPYLTHELFKTHIFSGTNFFLLGGVHQQGRQSENEVVSRSTFRLTDMQIQNQLLCQQKSDESRRFNYIVRWMCEAFVLRKLFISDINTVKKYC